ncbi:MAG: hypothetical protein J6M59_00810 [Bacteroidaceae bacterium]|nr:hypothetical protein [Bacteroidaceae bacterium]
MNFYNNKSHFNVCLKAFERNGLSSGDRSPMSAGAQIWEVDQNGNETLVAVLVKDEKTGEKIFKKIIK